MKLEIALIGGHHEDLHNFHTTIDTYRNDNELEITLHTFSDVYSVLNDKRVLQADVLFLDMELPDMTGMDLAERLRNKGYLGHIFFLTPFSESVAEDYEVHSGIPLMKPITYEQLKESLDSVSAVLPENQYICQKKNKITKIPYSDIICFSSDSHYIDILTTDANYRQRTTLSEIAKKLPDCFIRVHRSYIANLSHVKAAEDSRLVMSNNKTIPLPRNQKRAVMDALREYTHPI